MRITSTSCSVFPRPYRCRLRLRNSRRAHRNGSRSVGRNNPVSAGRPVMVRSRLGTGTWTRPAATFPAKRNTIASRAFRRSTASFWRWQASRSMSGMFGTSHRGPLGRVPGRRLPQAVGPGWNSRPFRPSLRLPTHRPNLPTPPAATRPGTARGRAWNRARCSSPAPRGCLPRLPRPSPEPRSGRL